MATAMPTRTPWRTNVRSWLQAAVAWDRQVLYCDLRTAAHQYAFPKSPALALVRWASKEFAAQLLKSILRSAATDAGIELSDTDLDILTDVALAMV